MKQKVSIILRVTLIGALAGNGFLLFKDTVDTLIHVIHYPK
jgi:hypothetical protein